MELVNERRYSEAVPYLQRAASMAQPEDIELYARTEKVLGETFLKLDDVEQGLLHLEKALAAFRGRGETDDAASLADILQELGSRSCQQGRWAHAMATLEEALTFYSVVRERRLGKASVTTWGINNSNLFIASCLLKLGRSAEALLRYEALLTLVEADRDKSGAANALVSIGLLCAEQGLAPRAIAAGQRVESMMVEARRMGHLSHQHT